MMKGAANSRGGATNVLDIWNSYSEGMREGITDM
jgi:hypothetical protein